MPTDAEYCAGRTTRPEAERQHGRDEVREPHAYAPGVRCWEVVGVCPAHSAVFPKPHAHRTSSRPASPRLEDYTWTRHRLSDSISICR
jgi:hypothetical protein